MRPEVLALAVDKMKHQPIGEGNITNLTRIMKMAMLRKEFIKFVETME